MLFFLQEDLHLCHDSMQYHYLLILTKQEDGYVSNIVKVKWLIPKKICTTYYIAV